MEPITVPTGLADRFACTLDGVCSVLAQRMVKPFIPHSFQKLAIFLLTLVWTRLRRATRRFAALTRRVAAGPLPPPRVRGPRAARPDRPKPPKPMGRLPEGFGWLTRFLPETNGYRSQLEHMLTEPEMLAFIAAAPQAGRILRPICRMLMIKLPPILRRPSARPGEVAEAVAPIAQPAMLAPPALEPAPAPPGNPHHLTWPPWRPMLPANGT